MGGFEVIIWKGQATKGGGIFCEGVDHSRNHDVPTLLEESVIPMIADKDFVCYVPKNLSSCGRSYVCTHGG